MKIIPIVFAFDNNMLFPAKICIESLLLNAKKETFYDIFILHGSKTEFNKEDFNKIKDFYKNCNFHFRSVGSKFSKCFEIRGVSVATYYRLMIPWVIPEYDKIMYSDVDVIFREDQTEIFESVDNMDNYYLAGVKSISAYFEEDHGFWKNMGINKKEIIYTGNLIINSKLMRKDKLNKEFDKHILKKYSEQDLTIMNIVCYKKIIFLTPRFCFTNFIAYYYADGKERTYLIYSEKEVENALSYGLIHYNGIKPWNGWCINFDIWWEYYRKSIFFDYKYYLSFFDNKINEFDQMSLLERLKKLYRYIRYGKSKKRYIE